MEEIEVKPSQAKAAIQACLEARQPVHVWGEPGIGKSQIIQQLSVEMGLAFQDVRAILLDPVDLRGLPHVNGDGKAHWAVPDFLPSRGAGLLLLDELNRAPVLVQNGCFQLILDRKLGEYELPEGWNIVAAGNRETHGGGVVRMPSALRNRFVHINMTVDLDDWCVWAAENSVDPVVIGFLRYRPGLLHEFDRNANAFPTPRSWEFVSKIIAKSQPQNIELALVSGAVGNGAAVEFAAFIKLFRNLPSIDAILLDPEHAPVPHDVGTLYAVSSAMAARAKVDNFARVIQYLDRLPPEYQVFSMKDAVTRDKALQSTGEFTKWAVAHADIM